MYIFYFVHATTTLLTNYTALHEHFTTIRADASELILAYSSLIATFPITSQRKLNELKLRIRIYALTSVISTHMKH